MSFNSGQWKANPKQEPFLALPTTIKEAFYGGGAGSGKSDVLLVYALVHRWHENARFKQVFMRRTFPELRNEIIPRSREIYTKFGATLNKSDMAWTFPRTDQYGGTGLSNAGAMIFLGQCEDENDVHKYDSMEINLFTPDELTSYTEYIYLYIGFTRVRTSDPSLPAIIRAAGMPGGIGHTWVKKRFVDPFPAGGKILEGRAGVKRIYIHSTQADNPHIDPTYKQSLAALNEAEKKAKLHGDWDAYQGQVFDEFRDHKYPDEPDNAIHVVEPFEIPTWWPRLVVGDWGFAANTWIGFAAISPTKRVYLYRELMWRRTKIEEWAPILKDFIEKDGNIKVVKFCKSAGQDRGQEHTIQQQIEEALGLPIELTNNSPGSRVAGKMLLHEYLRWKQKFTPEKEKLVFDQEQAAWMLRNRGMQGYNDYMNLFKPTQIENNIPKLQIFRCSEGDHKSHPNCCPYVIDAIKSASYDKPKKNKPAEDVAEWDGDDPYDGIRYVCDAADRYFDEAIDEFKKVQKQELLVQRLNANQDFTAFYRNARALESSDEIRPITRFHRSAR